MKNAGKKGDEEEREETIEEKDQKKKKKKEPVRGIKKGEEKKKEEEERERNEQILKANCPPRSSSSAGPGGVNSSPDNPIGWPHRQCNLALRECNRLMHFCVDACTSACTVSWCMRNAFVARYSLIYMPHCISE